MLVLELKYEAFESIMEHKRGENCLENIISVINKSTNSDEIKQLLKPLSKQNLIKIAKELEIHVRGNENKTEIINNIVLGTAEATYRSLSIRRILD